MTWLATVAGREIYVQARSVESARSLAVYVAVTEHGLPLNEAFRSTEVRAA